MKKLRILSVLTLLSVILIGLKPAPVCSCIGHSSVNDSYKTADMIVVGDVFYISKDSIVDSSALRGRMKYVKLGRYTESFARSKSTQYLTKALIKINKVYKGQFTSDTLTVYTGIGGGDCGFDFTLSTRYIIYGSVESYLYIRPGGKESRNTCWTNICTRTQDHNEAEIVELEKIIKQTNGG